MQELINISANENDEQLVNARELYEFLEIKTRFNGWIRNGIKDFDFIEGQDFEGFSKNLEKGRPTKEYALKLDMAKELSMLARNEKVENRIYLLCYDFNRINGTKYVNS